MFVCEPVGNSQVQYHNEWKWLELKIAASLFYNSVRAAVLMNLHSHLFTSRRTARTALVAESVSTDIVGFHRHFFQIQLQVRLVYY